MCTRLEVQEIVDRLEREMRSEFSHLRDERDVRMREIATTEINTAKDNAMKFIGWGGIVGVGAVVYFFGGLTNDVQYLQDEISKVETQLVEINNFMNAGDRYTTADGLQLKAYVDQQDEYILRRVEDGFDNLSEQIGRLHETTKN